MSETHSVRLVLPDGTERQLQVTRDEHIFDAGVREGLQLPHMCLQGWCLSCAGRVEGGGGWDQSDSRRYYQEDREAGYILLCTAKACSDLVVRTHQRVAMRDHRMRKKLPAPYA